jgi:hypothetical protein
MSRPDTSTRFVGWCPVCQRDIKVRSGKLVHHGYERPGKGYIVGDCPGVGYEPYETGTGAADHYLSAYVIPRVRALSNALHVLQSPAGPPYLTFEHYDIDTRRVVRDSQGYPENINLTHAQADELADRLPVWDRARYDWERKLGIAVAQTESSLKFWHDEETRIEGLIADWHPMPLKTVEEEIRRQEQTRAEREAAKGAARDQKIASEVSKIQKRIDSAVRNKNSATLADIYKSTKLRELSGWRLKDEEALALLDRDGVWAAFGLLTRDGYVHGEDSKPILDEMTWGQRIPSNRPGVRFDVGPGRWPEALGGGTAKTR